MVTKARRVGIYVRVSTDDQSTAMQKQELQAWADRAGHTVVRVFEDQGISGAKGRDKRPAFDALLKAAVRREIQMIAVWSSDRLGRSLKHLVEVLETIRDTGTGLYVHTQAVDTTTPSGRALFGMLAVFSEFEREMIAARVNAGLARVQEKFDRGEKHESKAGNVVARFGRPGAEPKQIKEARAHLTAGVGILKTAKLTGLGTGTVHKLAKLRKARALLQSGASVEEAAKKTKLVEGVVHKLAKEMRATA